MPLPYLLSDVDHSYLTAADEGDVTALQTTLGAGANRDVVDREDATAILLAARGGHLDAVRALIAAGVDVDAQDQTCVNPFLLGCMTADLDLVRIMVEAGADITRRTRMGGNGLTPAAEKGHLEVVRYLLENTRINVNLTNNLGWTALIETIILGDGGPVRQEIVELLLEHGARSDMPDPWGMSPADLARERGYDEIVRILDAHRV